MQSPIAEIDLSALRNNFAVVQRNAPDARVMAVVKSLAYGHGAIEIAQALADRVDALAVARTGEALTLRQAGITQPIIVLEGPSTVDELTLYVEHDLQLVVHQPLQVAWLRAHTAQPLSVWLKIDTGMHRLGFPSAEAGALIEELSELFAVSSLQLMTHLANADDLLDETTAMQVQRFDDVAQQFSLTCSIANSAGILAWPVSHADWVRPGLMLYGASPVLERTPEDYGLLPVMRLCAQLIAVNKIARGERVGYGGTWVAPHDMCIGVVGIGYGDGYPREVTGEACVSLNGQRAPIVGRVSMDMLTIDLGHIEADAGDVVELWGGHIRVDEVAQWAQTIPYTLFCGVTERVRRVCVSSNDGQSE